MWRWFLKNLFVARIGPRPWWVVNSVMRRGDKGRCFCYGPVREFAALAKCKGQGRAPLLCLMAVCLNE